MANFCHICGSEIPDGASFCTECGTKVASYEAVSEMQTADPAVSFTQDSPAPHTEDAVTPAQETTTPAVSFEAHHDMQTSKTVSEHIPHSRAERCSDSVPRGKYAPLGTGSIFALILLFALPAIGIIACIIAATAPKNVNIKHLARAVLIWYVIGILLTAAALITAYIFRDSIADMYRSITGGDLGDLLGKLSELVRNAF